MKTLPNIHPGEVLQEEFLTPLRLSQNALARAAAPHQRNRAGQAQRHCRYRVRLAAALGTSERCWLGLQVDYDLEQARRALGAQARKIVRIAA